MPEYSSDEAKQAASRAKDARYALLEARGALAKRPSVVVSSRRANATLGKAARQQEVEEATRFVQARSSATATLAEVAPIKADLDAQRGEVDREIEETENLPEHRAFEELTEQRHEAFSRIYKFPEGSPEQQQAIAAKDAIVPVYEEARTAHQSINRTLLRLENKKSFLKRAIPLITMNTVNLSNEVEIATSPTFEGWGLKDDSPEVRQELTEAITEGEKAAHADAAAERRAEQQAVAAAGGGEGASAGKTAGLAALGAGIGAVGVGLLGAAVGGIAGTFLGSTAIGAAVGAGAGALLGGLIGGGIGLGVGAFSGRKGRAGGGGGGAGTAAGGGAAPAQDPAQAREQDEQVEEQVQQAPQQDATGAAEGVGEPESRGGTPRPKRRRGIAFAADAENPELVHTDVQDFDPEDFEYEKRVPWASTEYGASNPDKYELTKKQDPFTEGGVGLRPKGQPRKTGFFENESRPGRELLAEQKRRAPSAFDDAPEPDADEWR